VCMRGGACMCYEGGRRKGAGGKEKERRGSVGSHPCSKGGQAVILWFLTWSLSLVRRYLHNNQIVNVTAGAFSGLVNLEYLWEGLACACMMVDAGGGPEGERECIVDVAEPTIMIRLPDQRLDVVMGRRAGTLGLYDYW
jgi:hypothetical protein